MFNSDLLGLLSANLCGHMLKGLSEEDEAFSPLVGSNNMHHRISKNYLKIKCSQTRDEESNKIKILHKKQLLLKISAKNIKKNAT